MMETRIGRDGIPELTAEVRSKNAAASLVSALQRRLSHTVELAAAEFRYATVSALAMLMLVVLTGAAIVLSWGFALAALVALLAAAGYSWPAIALGLAGLHLVAALVCWQLAMRLSKNLSLPALRTALGRQEPDA